ncbi:MAG: glycerophosphodiester phosphodiesterase family protein [Chloroflexota bacterium]
MPDSPWLTTTRPLIIGHRGAGADAPENTLAAFALALEQNADGVELDVQLCADGVPVIIHDDTVDRTCDGTGRVADLTLAELRRLTIADNHGVPTLDELFAALGRRTLYNVELKASGIKEAGLAAAVAGCIERHGVGDRVLVSSFSPVAVWAARRRLPRAIPVAHLRERRAARLFHACVPAEADHPAAGLVDASLMAWARRRRLRVNVWTVDDPAEARRLIGLGVDGIITNRPGALRAALA